MSLPLLKPKRPKIVQDQKEIEVDPDLALVDPHDVEREIQCESALLNFVLLYAIRFI